MTSDSGVFGGTPGNGRPSGGLPAADRAGGAIPTAVPAIRTHGLGKRFGGTQALAGIDLSIETGTIHALVGENGAGKSTLLGILAGRIQQSEGTFELFGDKVALGNARAARRAGVAAIYQELTIIPQLSAQANVFVASPRSRAGMLDEKAMRRRYDELCDRLGVSIPATAVARDLSVAQQQMLEIMRALEADARAIFFDEPTAPLGPTERDALFVLMRDLRSAGVTMVFVSHALEEVLSISDHVTVFRDGLLRVTRPVGEWTKQSLVGEMLGRGQSGGDVSRASRGSSAARASVHAVRPAGGLQVQNLRVAGSDVGVDLEIRDGEIVGLAGLVGSGRSSVLRALAGLDSRSSGDLWLDGTKVGWPRTVRQALRYGIALLPEDRKTQGLVLSLSAKENVALSDLRAVTRGPFVSMRRMRVVAAVAARGYGFDERRLDEVARNLSGGNQQKLLLARWGHRRPRFLLADEPTRGIDVGAKAEILATLHSMATEGLGVLVVSSELDEIASTCQRVVVLSGGRVVARLNVDLQHDSEENIVAQILYAAFHVENPDV